MRIRAVGGGNLQPTVTVTPSTSTQTIKPDPPYNGLSEVIVNPAPLEAATVKSSTAAQPAITPTAPNIGFSSITVEPNLLQTKAVTLPTSQPIRPDSGYYGLAGVNVSAPLYQYGTITPSASSRYLNIPSGNYGLDALTVDAAPLTILDVTPTSSPQSFTPTNPYIGYSRVTVGAASGYKTIFIQQNFGFVKNINIPNTAGITSVLGVSIFLETDIEDVTDETWTVWMLCSNGAHAIFYGTDISGSIVADTNVHLGTGYILFSSPIVTSAQITINLPDYYVNGSFENLLYLTPLASYNVIIWGT